MPDYTFDDAAREIRILRPDMPTPWINYLSNGTLHAMLSHAGGGLLWHRSPQIWRLTRYRFFHLPTDRPGPYIYIQDTEEEARPAWSPTYEPTRTRPERWSSAHGMGYTRFEAARDGIEADLTYFIPDLPGDPPVNALVWRLTLTNTSARPRTLAVTAYVEFALLEFLREIQWQCYNKHQVSVTYLEAADALVYDYAVEEQPKAGERPMVYFAADRPPGAFDGDRDVFIGSYRSESDPIALEQGMTGSTLRGGDPCGALQVPLTLAPGACSTVVFFLGTVAPATASAGAAITASLERLRAPGAVDAAFTNLQAGWDRYLGAFTCTVPDADAERQINTWTPYQAQRNMLYSRNISYYATGTFRGVGFRDTAQDLLAHIPFDLDASREKLRLLLGQQYRDGHVNHYFFPVEGWDPVTRICSDNHLWPIWTAWSLVMESGDLSFLDEQVPFYDGESASVYEHLCRAVAFTRAHLGARGFPLMLYSDWNDALFRVAREGRGESIWVAMLLGALLPRLAELSRLVGRPADAAEFMQVRDEQARLVNDLGWDGAWFRRAIMDDGRYLGTHAHPEARLWLNAQSWAVLSGMAEGDRGRVAMDAVAQTLDTDLGIKLVHPPITTFPDPAAPLTNYNPGTSENGGIFCHANTWAIIAECLLGRGDRAYKYYRQLIPHVTLQRAGLARYKAEPYAYASNLFGPDSDKFGWANVSWLTGTAAWMYVAATQYILGLRPQWEGLLLDPCLPSAWHELSIERTFRGCRYHIRIHAGTGRRALTVDGVPQEPGARGDLIHHVPGRTDAGVELWM